MNKCNFDNKYKDVLKAQNNIMYAFLYSLYTILIIAAMVGLGFVFAFGINWGNAYGFLLGVSLYVFMVGLCLATICHIWDDYCDGKRI